MPFPRVIRFGHGGAWGKRLLHADRHSASSWMRGGGSALKNGVTGVGHHLVPDREVVCLDGLWARLLEPRGNGGPARPMGPQDLPTAARLGRLPPCGETGRRNLPYAAERL